MKDWKGCSRSAALPVAGATICGFGWAFMCFKMPFTWVNIYYIVTFYNLIGNGPDFLLGFSVMLITMFAFSPLVNMVFNAFFEALDKDVRRA